MNIIILDGAVMTSREKAYSHIAKEFRLPDYFGKNLDALYDMVMDNYVNEDTIIILMNYQKMKKNLNEYADKIVSVFSDVIEEKEFIFIVKD